MRLLIDEKELALLLEKKRDLIGNKVTIDTIIAGISFLLSVFTASYDDLLGIRGAGIALKTIFCMIGIVYCLKIVKDVSEMVKNKYDHEVLLQDIEHLNMIQHNHSLIAIKNQVGEEKRYLVYYDERWDCKLFLNYKTQNGNNEAALKEQVSVAIYRVITYHQGYWRNTLSAFRRREFFITGYMRCILIIFLMNLEKIILK